LKHKGVILSDSSESEEEKGSEEKDENKSLVKRMIITQKYFLETIFENFFISKLFFKKKLNYQIFLYHI
jgi:hypothetical protein